MILSVCLSVGKKWGKVNVFQVTELYFYIEMIVIVFL